MIIWSYAVAGVSIEDNVNETWSPNANDFEDKKQFKVGLVKKKKALTKKKCTPAQKEAGITKGIQRAKASLFKAKEGDYEMAEIEKEQRKFRRVKALLKHRVCFLTPPMLKM